MAFDIKTAKPMQSGGGGFNNTAPVRKGFDISTAKPFTAQTETLSADQLEGMRQQEIAGKQQVAQLQAMEQQAQEQEKMNPANWTSKQMQDHYKKNPPQNVQEQAQANAAIEFKKSQEKDLTKQITDFAKGGQIGRVGELARSASIQDLPAVVASGVSNALMGVPEMIAKNPMAAITEMGAKGAEALSGVQRTDIDLMPQAQTERGKELQTEAGIVGMALPGGAIARTAAKGVGKAVAPLAEEATGLAIRKGILKTSERQIDKFIEQGISKGIRPSVVGKNSATQMSNYYSKARDAVKTIVENKNEINLVDEFGEVKKGLPKTLNEFSQAVDQVKTKIFNEYDDLAKQAGGQGLKLNLTGIADDIEKQVNNKAISTLYPEVKQQALDIAERLRANGEFTPQEAQEAIEMLNNSLKAFYRNPNPQAASRTVLDAAIVAKMRKGLDDLIEGATGESYKALKNKYGSLRAIQDDVTKRAIVDARKNAKGFFDLTDVFATGDIVKGLATMDPSAIAKGGGMHIMKRIFQHLNNPNRAVKNMFEIADKAYKPEKVAQAARSAVQTQKAFPEIAVNTTKALPAPKQVKLLGVAKNRGEGFEILSTDDAVNRIKAAPQNYSFSSIVDTPDSALNPVQLALKYYTKNTGKIVLPNNVIKGEPTKMTSLKKLGINPFTGEVKSKKLKSALEVAMRR